MAKRKFTEAGETAEKTKWNKAKTRKWKMTYELVEVKPRKKRRKKATQAAESTASATKKPKKKASAKKAKKSGRAKKKTAT